MDDAVLDAVWCELTGPGAPFEVTAIPVRGQSLRAFAAAPPSVRELWASTAAFAERDYLVYEGERVTYARAQETTRAVGAWLASRGVVAGDRVAIAMRNYPEWMLIYWACLSMGVAAVGMNAWWTSEEMAFALSDSAPKALFCDGERLERLLAIPDRDPAMAVVAVRTDAPTGVASWAEVAATPGEAPTAAIDPDDDACIFYTSGTTGRPKGAQLTHRGCINNLLNMAFASQALALTTARLEGTEPAIAPPPVALATTPLFHVTANNCLAYAATAAGGTIVLMHHWDAGEALRLIETERVTNVSGVPVMARELLNHPDFPRRDLSSLVALSGGGAQVPPDLVGKIDQAPAGAKPATGYGMTETCGIITAVSGEYFVRRPDSAGRVMPTFEWKLIGDDGETLPPGAQGELCVKGAGVIKGYLNRPEATAETIRDGWLRTGDVARVDEAGYVFIVDRKKDMVLRGGENVYCAEVEAALFRHPAVAEACVFGVPDERLGEEVGAAVVLRHGYEADADALRAEVIRHIARHKAPRYVWLLPDPLPRNASGKFLRRELKASLPLEAAG